MSLRYAIFTARHSLQTATKNASTVQTVSYHSTFWVMMNACERTFLQIFIFFFFRVLPTATRKKSAQTQTHIRNECSNLTFGGETKNKNIQHFFSWRVSVGFVNESRNSAHINNFKLCNTNLSNTLPVMNVSIFMLFCFPYFLFLLLFGCYFHLKLFVFIVLSHFFGISVILSRWIQIFGGDKTNGKKWMLKKST